MKQQEGSTLKAVLLTLIAGACVGMLTTLVITVIWPGEVKLVAPVFCSDGFDDAFVVRDETRVVPGEVSISYSLHCVGERGEVDEIGFLRPFLVLSLIHGVILMIVFVFWGIRPALAKAKAEVREERRAKRAGRASSTDDEFVDSSTAGPFVD